MTLLITGASGRLGRRTAELVLEGALTPASTDPSHASLNIDLPTLHLLARRWMRRPPGPGAPCSQPDPCGPPRQGAVLPSDK
jgi:hypothetical protein